eukprot:3681960-Amphidinium_carterae.2
MPNILEEGQFWKSFANFIPPLGDFGLGFSSAKGWRVEDATYQKMRSRTSSRIQYCSSIVVVVVVVVVLVVQSQTMTQKGPLTTYTQPDYSLHATSFE